MQHIKKTWFPLFFLIAFSLPAFGTNIEEEITKSFETEEVVVTATLSEKRSSEIPANIEVFSETEIVEMGARMLPDVLFEAQSTILQPTSGRMSVARLRGLNSKNTLVLIDGVRQPSGFQDYVDLSEIPVGMISRIEIVRGSSSALYGSEAIGGVINIITKKPTETFQANFNSRYGQSTYADANNLLFNAGATGSFEKFGYAVSGSMNTKDRYDRDDSDLMTDGDDKTSLSGSGKITYQLNPNINLALGLTYADTELKGVRTKTSGDFDRKVETNRLSSYIEFDSKIGDLSTIVARVQHSSYDWTAEMQPITKGSYSLMEIDQTTDQFDGRWSSLVFDQHFLTAGMEYRLINRDDDSTSRDINNFGAFIQDEMTFFKKLGITVGMRFDSHSDFGSAFSPKIASYYKLNQNFRVKGSYGEGFRAPSVYELYTGSLYTKKKILYANPDLDPEKSRSYELGFDANFSTFSFGVTAFKNDLRDMIGEIQIGSEQSGKKTIPVYELRNIDEATTQGFEINAEAKLPYGFSLSDALTIMEAKDEITDNDLLYVPTVSNIFKIAYANNKIGLHTNLRVVTTGEQTIEDDVKTEGYTLINFYGSKTLGELFSFYIGINNLFNADASAAYGNKYGAGITGTFFYGGLSLKL